MSCEDCAARRRLAREAYLKSKMGEVVTQVAKGVAEAAGIKKKTGKKELLKSNKGGGNG